MHYIDKANSKSRYSLLKMRTYKRLPYDGVRVKQFLVEVYGLRCCYCESAIVASSYFQVDHFYPQKLGQSYCNDIENYHLSCPRCNANKSDTLSNLSPNYYYDMNGNCWNYSSPKHFSKHIRYNGPKVESPTHKYDIFIQNLCLNGKTGIELKGWHLSLIDARSAYLLETQLLLQFCIKMLQKGMLNDAKSMLLFVSNRFKKNAHFSTMVVNNYGLAMKAMLMFLKKNHMPISAIVKNILS